MAKAKRRTHGGFPPDTEVLTADGWKKLYSMTRADEVLVHQPKSGWLKKSQIRKTVIPSGTWASEIRTDCGVLTIGEGEILPTSAGNRSVGAKWPTLGIYTAFTGAPQVPLNTGAIVLLVAAIRYGIVNEYGYSLRIRNAAQREAVRIVLGRSGSVCVDGWERWDSVLSTPRLRGLSLNLDGVCHSVAPIIRSVYNMFIEDTTVTRQQADEFQKYFITSGVGCLVSSASPNRCRLLFMDELSKVQAHHRKRVPRLVRLSGVCGKILLKQGECVFLGNIWQD